MVSNEERKKNFDKQIRHLPYRILIDIANALDDNDNWKALISAMPDSMAYKQSEVNMFDRMGMKRGGSSSECLLQDMGTKCITVKQLVGYLHKINNIQALLLLHPDEPVVITLQPQSVSLMAGGTVELSCQATGFPIPEYQWFKNEVKLTHACERILLINNLQATDNGFYSCTVSNSISTARTNRVEVQVMDRVVGCQPPRITQHPISAIIPIGQNFILSCQVENPKDCNYQWTVNGNEICSETSSSIKFKTFNYEHEGNYTCRVFNSRGDALTRVATLEAWAPTEESNNQYNSQIPSELTNTATDKVALVFGNRDYCNLPPNESPLVHTCGDAQIVASILRKNLMGFKVIALVNQTSQEMHTAISMFCDLLGPGVYGLVYFAGHGFEDSGQNYMIPVDAKADWTPDKAVCVQEILHRMHARRTALSVFLLDICRRTVATKTEYQRKIYQYPPDAQSVFGFATCPGAAAYERKADANGLYVKHLIKNITNHLKIEDMLQDVAKDVEAEVANDNDVWRMRPQYHSKTVKKFSLRDEIVATNNEIKERNKKWLEIHRLPPKHVFKARHGIEVEIRFEHTNWLSNVILVCLRVLNLGQATMCETMLVIDDADDKKGSFQKLHFHPTTTNQIRQVVPSAATTINARALGSSCFDMSNTSVPVETISEIYNIQRLKENLCLTIELKYRLPGSEAENTFYEVKAFNLSEFGIINAFKKASINDSLQEDSIYSLSLNSEASSYYP